MGLCCLCLVPSAKEFLGQHQPLPRLPASHILSTRCSILQAGPMPSFLVSAPFPCNCPIAIQHPPLYADSPPESYPQPASFLSQVLIPSPHPSTARNPFFSLYQFIPYTSQVPGPCHQPLPPSLPMSTSLTLFLKLYWLRIRPPFPLTCLYCGSQPRPLSARPPHLGRLSSSIYVFHSS